MSNNEDNTLITVQVLKNHHSIMAWFGIKNTTDAAEALQVAFHEWFHGSTVRFCGTEEALKTLDSNHGFETYIIG